MAWPMLSGIYAVLDRAVTPDPAALADQVLAAGIRVVQYRDKAGTDPTVLAGIVARAAPYGALVVVNDDIEAALAFPGLGVHLGQEDMTRVGTPGLRARLLGRVLGISCGTTAETEAAERLGADYVGVGPYAVTATKLDAGAPLGLAGIRGIASRTSLPVVAIGGIGAADVAPLVAAGAAMVAVVRAIADAPVPAAAAADLIDRWARAGRHESA